MEGFFKAVEQRLGQNVTAVEKDWLRDLYHHVEVNIIDSSSSDIQLALSVVDKVLNSATGMQLPLSYSFISVQQLVQRQHLVCCSQLATQQLRRGATTSTEGITLKPISHIHFLLLGRLTPAPRTLILQEKNKVGQLYIEDKTGAVLCETLTLYPDILGQLVFLPSWNYIPFSSHKKGHTGYLEVTMPPCRLIPEETCQNKEHVSSITVPAAANILINRSAMVSKVINIQGHITALSTILRVKGVVFFMFKLSYPKEQQHVSVIIKGTQLAHLYHLLEPGREYIITGLRPTTLFKGSADSRNVFCSTTGTQFLPLSAQAQDVHGRQPVLPGSCKTLQDLQCGSDRGRVRQEVCSYQGTITACVDRDAGIYQLDGKVRLHLGYQLHVNEGRCLRVGACVAVCNAHLINKHEQGETEMILCCCTFGCVVVQSFSTLCSPHQPPSGNVAVLRHLLYYLNPNLDELLFLLSAVNQLRLKFTSHTIRWVNGDMPTALTT